MEENVGIGTSLGCGKANKRSCPSQRTLFTQALTLQDQDDAHSGRVTAASRKEQFCGPRLVRKSVTASIGPREHTDLLGVLYWGAM